MKRIIEIEEKDYEKICKVANETKSSLGIVPLASSIITQSKPYDDSGDLISREALRKEVTEKVNFTTVDGHIAYDKMLKLIDDAPTVEPACWNCEHFGEKAVTGHCIKCRDKDMWERKGGAE